MTNFRIPQMSVNTKKNNNYENEKSGRLTKKILLGDENIDTRLDDIGAYNVRSSIITDGYVKGKDTDTSMIGDYVDGRDFPSIYETSDDFSGMLTNVFQTLLNASFENNQNILKGLHFVREKLDTDPCQRWLNNQDKLEAAFSGEVI